MQEYSSSRDSVWLYLGFGFAAALIGVISGLLIFKLENPFFAIAGAIAIVFALITVTNVELGLLALVFMVYTRTSDVLMKYHDIPSIAKPYIALLIVAILVRWVVGGQIAAGWGRSAVLVGAYGLVVFSSLLYAADFEFAMKAVLNFLKDGIIAVVLVILIQDGRVFKGVIWALLLAGIFVGSISAYQGITGDSSNDFGGFGQVGYQNIIGEMDGSRLSGPVGDPNFYAQSMLVLIPIALSRFLKEKNWFLKAIAGWVFLASTLAVIFSYSRGAAVAAVLMLLFAVLHSPPRLADVLIAILLLILIITFIPNPYIERLATITDIFGDRNAVVGEVSYRGRASEVIAAWLMFIDHPIFGVGVENYPVFYQSYSRKLGLDPRLEQRQAHNLYLQVAAETGLAGILVFGGLLTVMLSGMLKAWRKLKDKGITLYADLILSTATGIVGYLGAAMFIHGAYPRYFWLLAGIALAIPQVADHILKDAKQESDDYRI
jgi:O-antigen ligase